MAEKKSYTEDLKKEEIINLIDEIFSTGVHMKAAELLKRLNETCDVSRASLYRYLEYLEDKLHAPLDKDIDNKYFYTDKTFRIPHLMTTKSQMQAAQEMTNLLEVVKGTPVYDEVKKVFDVLSNAAPKLDHFGNEYDTASGKNSGKLRKIFLGAPSAGFEKAVWDEINESLEKNRNLQFNYRRAGKDVYKVTVQPWQLIFDNGNWNLWCWNYQEKATRMYTLSEMTDVHLTRDEFQLPEKFDFHEFTPGTFGSYCNGKFDTYKLKLKAKSYILIRAVKRVWGWNQKIEYDADGNAVISFESDQYHPILTWVRSWAPDVIPLGPEKLVADWKDGIRKLVSELGENLNK